MNSKILERRLEILLVDDNPGDVRLTVEALKDGDVQNRLHTARDGKEAIAFLRREGAYDGAPRPDLVLLDLNMPGVNGLQVLAEIKQDPVLRSIPVIILTGSHAMDDIVKTYDLDANCYVTKPDDFEQFILTVKSITDFWSVPVRPPEEES